MLHSPVDGRWAVGGGLCLAVGLWRWCWAGHKNKATKAKGTTSRSGINNCVTNTTTNA